MKKKIAFYLIISMLVIGLFFYVNSTSEESINAEKICINISDCGENIDISEFVEDSLFIAKLETTSEIIIGDISKIKIRDNRIYISDKMSHILFVFSLEGKLISKINSKGRAKNEYINLTDFEVIDGKIIIFDYMSMKMLIYNSYDMTFERSISTSMVWGEELVNVNDEILLVNGNSVSETGKYHLYKLDLQKGMFTAMLPFENSNQGWGISKYNTTNSNNSMFIFPPFDYVYCYENGEVLPKFHIDFGNDKMDDGIVLGDPTEAINMSLTSKKILGVSRIENLNSVLAIWFENSEKSYKALYNSKTKNVKLGQHFIIDRYGTLPMGNFTIDRNYLINSITASEFLFFYSQEILESRNASFKNKYDEQRFINLRDQTSREDNPIIFFSKTISHE